MNLTVPRPYLTSVTRVADLFSSRVRDGERVSLLGYESEGDGGGQEVYWDRGSSATINGGSVFPGKGGVLSFDENGDFDGQIGEGRYLSVESLVSNVRRFGAKGDNATDDTFAFNRARDSARVIYVPPGRYVLNEFRLSSNAVLQGVRGDTYIRAAENLKFAVIASVGANSINGSPNQKISRIVFDGSDDDGIARKRCGLYVVRSLDMEDVTAVFCVIGIASTTNYYGHWNSVFLSRCDVGMVHGAWIAGSSDISDLRQGDSVSGYSDATVTLPYFHDNQFPSWNKLITDIKVNLCRVGIAHLERAANITYLHPSVEACRLGMLFTEDHAKIEDAWFEANASQGSVGGGNYDDSDVIDGITFTPSRDIELARPEGGAVPIVKVQGGRLNKSTGGNDTLLLSSAHKILADFENPSTYFTEAVIDAGTVDNFVDRVLYRNADIIRGASSKECPRITRQYGMHGYNGSIVEATDCTIAPGDTNFVALGGDGTLELVADGVFEDGLCWKRTSTTGTTGVRRLGLDFVAGKTYLLTIVAKSDQDADLQPLLTNTGGLGVYPLPANKWRAFKTIFHGEEVDSEQLWLIHAVDSGSIWFSGIGLYEFDNYAEAVAFQRSSHLVLPEDDATRESKAAESVTGSSPTLAVNFPSSLDASSNSVSATLPDGRYAGQQKVIIVADASNAVTVSVTSHETSIPEVFTASSAGDYLVLMWTGQTWVTIKTSFTV